MNRRTLLGIAVLCASLQFAGCRDSTETKLKQLGKDEKATIKVMSNLDVKSFYNQYGALFMAKHTNIDLQVASTQGVFNDTPVIDINKEFEKFVDDQKPDVLLLMLNQYEDFAAKGRLYELDPIIRQDNFDLTGIMPTVIETIKSRSGGKLYGLAPGFVGDALYYNKTLFAKYGVPLPKDKMNWEELLELARRFPTTGDESSRVYGFAFDSRSDNVFQNVRMIGDSKGLSYVDTDNGTVTIRTEPWKQTAQLALDALKSGAIYVPSPDKQFLSGSSVDYYRSDPFIGGKVAMTIKGNFFMDQLNSAKPHLKELMPDWDMVTIPVDPQNPDGAGGMNLYSIFAVNSQSPNPRAAWEFVKYVNDDEYARVASKSFMDLSTLPARTKYFREAEGRNVAAFAMQKGSSNKANTKLPAGFGQTFSMLADTEFKAVLEEKKTVDEALKTIQDKGQELFKAMLAEQNK